MLSMQGVVWSDIPCNWKDMSYHKYFVTWEDILDLNALALHVSVGEGHIVIKGDLWPIAFSDQVRGRTWDTQMLYYIKIVKSWTCFMNNAWSGYAINIVQTNIPVLCIVSVAKSISAHSDWQTNCLNYII